MFEQLINLAKENAEDLIVKNNAVPDHHNDEAISEAGNSIHNVLGSAVNNGNIEGVLGIFGNSENLKSNPLVGNMVSQFAGTLGKKFAVSGAQATSIAASLIPQILGRLTQKTNDPNDSSLNINDIMESLSGGKTKGVDFGDILSKLQGGKGFDFGDLTTKLLGGKKGGISDIIGGFFK